jgi:hypothetical protein
VVIEAVTIEFSLDRPRRGGRSLIQVIQWPPETS